MEFLLDFIKFCQTKMSHNVPAVTDVWGR